MGGVVGAYRRVWANRPLRALLAGEFISSIGDWLYLVAILLLGGVATGGVEQHRLVGEPPLAVARSPDALDASAPRGEVRELEPGGPERRALPGAQ